MLYIIHIWSPVSKTGPTDFAKHRTPLVPAILQPFHSLSSQGSCWLVELLIHPTKRDSDAVRLFQHGNFFMQILEGSSIRDRLHEHSQVSAMVITTEILPRPHERSPYTSLHSTSVSKKSSTYPSIAIVVFPPGPYPDKIGHPVHQVLGSCLDHNMGDILASKYQSMNQFDGI